MPQPVGWVVAALLLSSVGCDGGQTPRLGPIAPQALVADEEYSLVIAIHNPDGRPVRLGFEGPALAGWERVTRLTLAPAGALFRWVPLGSHVGTHELTFSLTDPNGHVHDRVRGLFRVLPGRDSGPVFLKPGSGRTFSRLTAPCVDIPIEVRDADSTEVHLGVRSPLPQLAALIREGAKRARISWCPTPEQFESRTRYRLELYADDGDHPRVEHDFLLVFRSPTKEGCPGGVPSIRVVSPAAGARVVAGRGYEVMIEAKDDVGLRDAPLLYYTRKSPPDLTKPDHTAFEHTLFEPVGGARYRAFIPPLGEARAPVRFFFFVSAVDNDDPTGAVCDHYVETPVASFVGEAGRLVDATLDACKPCRASSECRSGVCAEGHAGGRCLTSCAGDTLCRVGACGPAVSVEGPVRAACGPVRGVCEEQTACANDDREPDNTAALATWLTSAERLDGEICPGDTDWYRVAVGARERVTVEVDAFDHRAGDIDLRLRDRAERLVATSESAADQESASYCGVRGDDIVYAQVFGFASFDRNAYRIRVLREPGGCACVDDPLEARGGDSAAEAIDVPGQSFEGRLCPRDEDWFALEVEAPSHVRVGVSFDVGADVDLEVYAADGRLVRSSHRVVGDETFVGLASRGRYTLRLVSRVEGAVRYRGEVAVRAIERCTTAADCPLDTVCSGTCGVLRCASAADCPPRHVCTDGGACALACADEGGCRSGEACKWLGVGFRACVRAGTRSSRHAFEPARVRAGTRSSRHWALR